MIRILRAAAVSLAVSLMQPSLANGDEIKVWAARAIATVVSEIGPYVASLVERLGIAKAIASKVTRPDSDIVAELVAKGEVELGVVVITQILTTPGVDLVGPLPPEIQSDVVFTAGLARDRRRRRRPGSCSHSWQGQRLR